MTKYHAQSFDKLVRSAYSCIFNADILDIRKPAYSSVFTVIKTDHRQFMPITVSINALFLCILFSGYFSDFSHNVRDSDTGEFSSQSVDAARSSFRCAGDTDSMLCLRTGVGRNLSGWLPHYV